MLRSAAIWFLGGQTVGARGRWTVAWKPCRVVDADVQLWWCGLRKVSEVTETIFLDAVKIARKELDECGRWGLRPYASRVIRNGIYRMVPPSVINWFLNPMDTNIVISTINRRIQPLFLGNFLRYPTGAPSCQRNMKTDNGHSTGMVFEGSSP